MRDEDVAVQGLEVVGQDGARLAVGVRNHDRRLIRAANGQPDGRLIDGGSKGQGRHGYAVARASSTATWCRGSIINRSAKPCACDGDAGDTR